jgi:peptidoglycan glycosyltransferase
VGYGWVRWTLTGALVLALAAAGCTGTEESNEGPTATDVARGFTHAWSDGDYAMMVETFESDRRWTADRLGRWMRRALARGAVTSYEVVLLDEVDEPSDDATQADAQFVIKYESDAIADPIALEGAFELTRDTPDDAWIPRWDESLLWPGIKGAVAFDIHNNWPKRAPIHDRSGRTLAAGAVGNRRYPHGSVGGSVVGHIETLSRTEARERELEPGALVGGSGLEEAFDATLAGQPASRLTVVDSEGDRIEVLGGIASKRGRKVRTSLDIDVQRATEAAYGPTTGGVAVVDPRTGDLLAAVGSGPFDPNNYVGATDVNPFNRALAGLYPPGSSMKVVTAAAALEEKVVTPGTTLTGPKEYKGVRNFESGEFGSIPFASAVQYSVNTAFAQVAERLGAERLTEYAEAFGFNRVPDIPLDVAQSSFPAPDGLGDLMWASIGQAQVVATPLQMATVVASIANNGKRMEPRIDMRAAPQGNRVVSRRTASQLTEMLENVVIGGTGSAARITGLRIAGKTGTAEVQVNGKIKNHAWFICFAPVEDPRVAVAVVSELGGIGGQVAAPLARQVLVSVLPLVK